VYCRLLRVLTAVLLTSACSTKPDVTPPRYAVLRFENLTPDPQLNWVGHAASEVLARQIGAIPSSAIYAANENFGRRPIGSPGVSTELTDAMLAGANRILTGYFELLDNGTLAFHVAEEEARTGKRLRDLSAQGSVLAACNALAKQINSAAKPFPTSSEAALRAYIQGAEGDGVKNGSDYQTAIAADPNFADAYLSWSEFALAHRDPETVDRVLAEATARKIEPAVLAKLQLAAATAHGDPNARTAALERMVETEPTNLIALQALGEAHMANHRFAEAAATFGKAAPELKPDLLNLKAYALMYNGDEKGALEAVRKFRSLRPQDPNALDSEGDINYYFGHFAEAEKLYLASAAMNPQFNQGMETWKAARARLITGDVAGASQVFGNYRTEREKVKDPSLPYRIAYWQFLTGDSAGSLAAMRRVGAEATNPGLKSLALAQSAIWELQLGSKADAIKDAQSAMQAEQGAAAVPAIIVRFSAMEPAGLPALRARADRMFNGAAGATIRLLAVGYALYFANRTEEAVGVWKQLYEQSDPADPVSRALYATLLTRTGHQAEGSALLKNSPAPIATPTPSFESLYLKPGNTVKPAK
jgi:tetratricopeptide (TPR) repeat protein